MGSLGSDNRLVFCVVHFPVPDIGFQKLFPKGFEARSGIKRNGMQLGMKVYPGAGICPWVDIRQNGIHQCFPDAKASEFLFYGKAFELDAIFGAPPARCTGRYSIQQGQKMLGNAFEFIVFFFRLNGLFFHENYIQYGTDILPVLVFKSGFANFNSRIHAIFLS
jgi:hypothetical protein